MVTRDWGLGIGIWVFGKQSSVANSPTKLENLITKSTIEGKDP